MSHPNARLTPKARLDLVREVAAGWTRAEAARRFRVSRATATKWVRRYGDEGEAGLRDRCSRPRRSPGVTAPDADAAVLGMAPSTAYAVLRRAGLHRRDRMHRVNREAVRYERGRPGELLPLDARKLGRAPPAAANASRPGFAETRSGPRGKGCGGPVCAHAAGDRSRYAYAEALPTC